MLDWIFISLSILFLFLSSKESLNIKFIICFDFIVSSLAIEILILKGLWDTCYPWYFFFYGLKDLTLIIICSFIWSKYSLLTMLTFFISQVINFSVFIESYNNSYYFYNLYDKVMMIVCIFQLILMLLGSKLNYYAKVALCRRRIFSSNIFRINGNLFFSKKNHLH